MMTYRRAEDVILLATIGLWAVVVAAAYALGA